jgi:general stress protein 26
MKDEILKFMQKHELCVISSVNYAGNPESAFVGYSFNNRFEIRVGTSDQSRKFKNISKNPNVSIVIADENAEVQYEGQAKKISKSSTADFVEDHFAKIPSATKYREDPAQVWIMIMPTWIRYIKHGAGDIVEEIKEFA